MSKHHVSDPPKLSLLFKLCSADKKGNAEGRNASKEIIARLSSYFHHSGPDHSMVDPWFSTHCLQPREDGRATEKLPQGLPLRQNFSAETHFPAKG